MGSSPKQGVRKMQQVYSSVCYSRPLFATCQTMEEAQAALFKATRSLLAAVGSCMGSLDDHGTVGGIEQYAVVLIGKGLLELAGGYGASSLPSCSLVLASEILACRSALLATAATAHSLANGGAPGDPSLAFLEEFNQ